MSTKKRQNNDRNVKKIKRWLHNKDEIYRIFHCAACEAYSSKCPPGSPTFNRIHRDNNRRKSKSNKKTFTKITYQSSSNLELLTYGFVCNEIKINRRYIPDDIMQILMIHIYSVCFNSDNQR